MDMKMFANFENFAKKILNYASSLKNKEIVEYIKVFKTDLNQGIIKDF